MSLNRVGVKAWWRCQFGVVGPDGRCTRTFTELQNQSHLAEAFRKDAPTEGNSPVRENAWDSDRISRVAPDPGKPA